ncbi:MAG TPA: DNA-processing protein DprA [Candidatus Cloacimonadota bacterium]|nr:DNA-processing protein DprA [Candidatus Cloacimonadota bacterium]HPM00704.1 DNA-processing protein DprA [Candidatus Cloacimonadota bacterium]
MLLRKIKAWLTLQEFKTLKFDQLMQLIEQLGHPENYIGEKNDLWLEVDFLNPQMIDLLQRDYTPQNWDKIVKIVENFSLQFISILDDEYPEELKTIFHAPLFLFCLGDISLLKKDKKGAVVGTRKPSAYGRMITQQMCKQLCLADYVIVSGLAAGIDSEAHKTALETNGKTIAVLAHGLEMIYPPQNRDLAKEIKQNGLLITEYPPYSKMNKWYFIQRNRIISGLSRFTAVMEGKAKSGAMLTANFALEQGRDIFALPGNINCENAEGPNNLIQKGANCINTVHAVNDFYNEIPEFETNKTIIDLNPDEELIYKIVKDNPPHIHADDLILITSFDFGKLSSTIFMLELKNLIRKIDGNSYMCCN